MISAEAVSRSFSGRPAVRSLSFTVASGETVGFLGRNGAGKTTTLRLLTGALAPSSGRLEVAGAPLPDARRQVQGRIGYLPELPALHEGMTVAAFLRFCGRLRDLDASRIEERLDQVLTSCDLVDSAERRIETLSKGFRQRVGVAQALIHDPDLLILDEPTTALDPAQVRDLRDLLVKLSTEPREPRRTLLLSTHRLEDVVACCRRVLVISDGELVADEQLATDLTTADLERRFLSWTEGAPLEIRS
ncbi:MAG: ABC transporter ATP-binding protein [Acidobacteriota bacterium]